MFKVDVLTAISSLQISAEWHYRYDGLVIDASVNQTFERALLRDQMVRLKTGAPTSSMSAYPYFEESRFALVANAFAPNIVDLLITYPEATNRAAHLLSGAHVVGDWTYDPPVAPGAPPVHEEGVVLWAGMGIYVQPTIYPFPAFAQSRSPMLGGWNDHPSGYDAPIEFVRGNGDSNVQTITATRVQAADFATGKPEIQTLTVPPGTWFCDAGPFSFPTQWGGGAVFAKPLRPSPAGVNRAWHGILEPIIREGINYQDEVIGSIEVFCRSWRDAEVHIYPTEDYAFNLISADVCPYQYHAFEDEIEEEFDPETSEPTGETYIARYASITPTFIAARATTGGGYESVLQPYAYAWGPELIDKYALPLSLSGTYGPATDPELGFWERVTASFQLS